MKLPDLPDCGVPPELPGELDKLAEWLRNFSKALLDHANGVVQLSNSGIDYDRPFSEEGRAGNMRSVFRHFVFAQPVGGPYAAFPFMHQFGDDEPPRGWKAVMVQEPGVPIVALPATPTIVLDQIVSSIFTSPYTAGYPTADVGADRYTITGSAGIPFGGGWVDNDVRVGDEISLTNQFPGAGTITTVAGSADVVGAGAAFKTNLKVGWSIRIPGAANPLDQSWRPIINISDDDNLEVGDAFFGANAAVAYEVQASDLTWKRIETLTDGGAAGDIITLDPDGPGTDLPVTAPLNSYVIRRPPTEIVLWVKVITETPYPVTVTIEVF